MKKLYLLLFSAVLFASYEASAQPYIFSQFTSTYGSVSGTTISASGWDEFTVYTLKLPFTFHYFDANFDTLYVMGGFVGFTYDGVGTFGNYEIPFYDAEFTDNGSSVISYQVSGSTPNRIFKLQTSNAGFANDPVGNDYANVQLWFYEGSNIIEMHYGASSVVESQSWPITPCPGPTVGLLQTMTVYVSLSGPASNPTASSTVGSLCVTGAPPNGKVYKFVPNANGVNEFEQQFNFTVSPNPSKGIFAISTNSYLNDKVDVSIVNCLGELSYKKEGAYFGKSLTLNAGLQPGIYFIRLSSEHGSVTKKLIIQ